MQFVGLQERKCNLLVCKRGDANYDYADYIRLPVTLHCLQMA